MDKKEKATTAAGPVPTDMVPMGQQHHIPLNHFAKAIGLDRPLGQAMLTALYTSGLVNRPHEFYTLTVEALVDTGLINEPYAIKVMDAVNNNRNVPLFGIVHGLMICGTDTVLSKRLTAVAKTLPHLAKLTRTELLEGGIRAWQAESIGRWLEDPVNQEELKLLASQLTVGKVHHVTL